MESKLHKELKDRAIKYMFDKSYWLTRPEVDCGYYGRYDVWGIKSSLDTMGIEVKVSRADFKNNRWKEHRLDFGVKQPKIFDGILPDVNALDIIPANENYILCPSGMLNPDEIHPKYGLLWFDGNRLVNKKKAEFIEMTDKRKLLTVMLFLSSKQNSNLL